MKKVLFTYSIFFFLLFTATESKAVLAPTQGMENQSTFSEKQKGKAKIDRLKKKLSAYVDKKGKGQNDSEKKGIGWLSNVGLILGITSAVMIFSPLIINFLGLLSIPFTISLGGIPIAILGTVFSGIALWKIKKNVSGKNNRKQRRKARRGFWLSLGGMVFLISFITSILLSGDL